MKNELDLVSTVVSVSSLGDHAALYGPASKIKLVKKLLRYCTVDKETFSRNISAQCEEVNTAADINVVALQVADLYVQCSWTQRGRGSCCLLSGYSK